MNIFGGGAVIIREFASIVCLCRVNSVVNNLSFAHSRKQLRNCFVHVIWHASFSVASDVFSRETQPMILQEKYVSPHRFLHMEISAALIGSNIVCVYTSICCDIVVKTLVMMTKK